MSNRNDDRSTEVHHSVPLWCVPYTKNQNEFFMAVLYEGLCDGEHKFETRFIPDGNELALLMLSEDVDIERIYVVSFPDKNNEEVLMEYMDEFWVGALNEKSKKTGLGYVAITEGGTQHVFTRFGEIAPNYIEHQTLFFSSSSVETVL